MASKDRIPPGGEGKIEVKLNTKSYKGRVSKSIKVKSNDSDNQLQILRVKTFVKVDIVVNPERLKFYTDYGKGKEYTITLTNKTDKTVKITQINSTFKHVDVSRIERLNPKSSETIKAVLNKNTPPGRLHGYIHLHTDLPSMKRISIRFWGKVREEKEQSQKN